MIRKDNLEKTEKLLKFAIENGLRAKNSVKIDLDIDSSSYDQFIERVMIFIDVDLDGDGMYELRDITFELARQKKIIEEVLEHPKLQFRHDGSLGSLPNTKNLVSEVGILRVNIDPDNFYDLDDSADLREEEKLMPEDNFEEYNERMDRLGL
jgi:hypothetical protein